MVKESAFCPLCGPRAGSQAHREIEGWNYRRCVSCGLLYLDPRPTEEEMRKLYESPEYYDGGNENRGYATYDEDREFYVATYRRRLERVRDRLPAGARVLDVGSGFGYMIEAATQAGMEAWALDVEGAGLRRCAGLVGERAVPLTEASLRLPAGHFDLITLFDVIEHVYDPIAAVRSYADWLKPGGFLMMTTPDSGSLLARISGRRWVSYKTPEHICIYNRESLRRLTEPLYELAGLYSERQCVSLPFLAKRLRRLFTPAGMVVGAAAALPWLGKRGVNVTSGSLTVIGRKRG